MILGRHENGCMRHAHKIRGFRALTRECGCNSAFAEKDHFSMGMEACHWRMTETDYEHECLRAELLGIEKPSREEFFTRQKKNAEKENDEAEGWLSGVTEELDQRNEGLNQASGGLEELTSILSVTQKRINHLKTVCGSFTRMLKLHSVANKENVHGESSNPSSMTTDKDADNLPCPTEGEQEVEKRSEPVTPIRKPARGDIQSAVDSQLSKLDSLISKAEKADLSLSSQNKQIKKFLK